VKTPTKQSWARIPATVAILGFTVFARAQDWQFTFDLNGNLTTQTAGISAPPEIISQPRNQVVRPGESTSFSVVAADTRDLSYQWRFNDLDIIGAIGETLLLNEVSIDDEGQYAVVLTNPSGSLTSAPALLMIDTDRDGLGDSWEQAHFGNLAQSSTGDSDGDGVSNGTEFQDGTNPTDSTSALFGLTLISDGGHVTVTPGRFRFSSGEMVTLRATAFAPHSFHGWGGAIEATNNPITLTITNDITIFAYLSSYDISWKQAGLNGRWHDRANWVPRLVPASNDNVFLIETASITNNSDAICRTLSVGGPGNAPSLAGNGTLTVLERCDWRGGSMANVLAIVNRMNWTAGNIGGAGRTVIAPGAVLNINNPSSVNLLGHTLENRGTIRWTGANINMSLALITNGSAALFHAQNAAVITFITTGGNRFDNAGIFRKSGNAGTTTVGGNLAFNNYGIIDVQSGTLFCNNSFLNNGTVNLAAGTTNRIGGNGSANGSFDAPATALVEWIASGTFTLNAGAQLNGPGLYRINGSTLALNSDASLANLDLMGTLTGPGRLTVNDVINWSSGTMSGSSRTVIAPGATMNINNPSAVTLSTRTLDNGGTTLWTGTGISLNAATITNRPGALFHAQSAAAISFLLSGGNRFDNAGTFRKTSPGTTTIGANVAFNNYNLVDIQIGTLFCNNDFLNNGTVTLAPGTTNRIAGSGSASGSFDVPATALVEWTGSGTFNLNSGAQLNGTGQYRINGSTLACNAPVSVANIDLLSSLSGTGALTVNTVMNWPSGTMSGTGRTVIAPGATLNINNPSTVFLTTRTLENGGTVLWTGTNITLGTAVITNRPGGLFQAQNAATIGFTTAGNRIDNAGTFRKSANTGTTTIIPNIAFNNYNTVEIRSGILTVNGGYTSRTTSILNCALGGTTPGSGFGQLQAGGTVNLNGLLNVDFINGFVPAVNDSFAVVTAGTRTGTFVGFSYPTNEVTMQMSNTPTSVIVRVIGVSAPRPMLLTPELSGSNVNVTWTAISNITYRLEFTSDPGLTNWNAFPGDVTSLSNRASRADSLTTSNRFYRVRVIP
jgi:hypothetical protein